MKTYSHTITNPRDHFNKDRFSINNEWFVVCDGVSCGRKRSAGRSNRNRFRKQYKIVHA